MDNVLDFIILKKVYKDSMKQKWRAGEQFQCLIGKRSWFGTIRKRKPFSEDAPKSAWQLYCVKFDDGTTDQLSPWDLRPLEIDNGDSYYLCTI